MIAIHPQYIKDVDGKDAMVVLSVKEFEKLMEQLEDLEDVKLYDEAKKNDDGIRVLLSEYLKKRSQKNA